MSLSGNDDKTNFDIAFDILRGVIDSVMCPRDRRLEVWRRLGRGLDMDKLNTMTKRIGLAETLDYANQLLSGTLRERTVVAVTR